MHTAERKPDRRIQKTRALLRDALIALIGEKGYDTIAIHDITDRANVSRATFYLHYKDKEDLLFKSNQEIYDDLVRDISTPSRRELQEKGETPYWVDASDFEHIGAHRSFYATMLGERGVWSYIAKVLDFSADVQERKLLRPIEAQGKHPSPVPVDLISAVVAGAGLGAMRWWLHNGQHYSATDMGRMLNRILAYGMWWCMGLGDIPRPARPDAPGPGGD